MDAHLAAATADIAKLCAELGVVRLDVFGSAAADEPVEPPHDYDFLVELSPDGQVSRARRWIALAQELEARLGKPVDLVSPSMVRNPYFVRAIEESRMPVYARSERPRAQAAV